MGSGSFSLPPESGTPSSAGSKAGGSLKGLPHDDDPPPVLGTWPRVYAFVVAYLAAVIGAFYFFTIYFAP